MGPNTTRLIFIVNKRIIEMSERRRRALMFAEMEIETLNKSFCRCSEDRDEVADE